VLSEIDIDRPVDVVAGFAADPTNAPSWYRNIESVTWLTDPPLRTGSAMTFVAHFLGRRLSYTYEVIELVPGERLVMSTAEGPFPMETSYVWMSLSDGGTRMALRNRGEPSGFVGMSAPLMGTSMRRANRKDLQALKQLLERS
jgi:uncharacterized membrane protein